MMYIIFTACLQIQLYKMKHPNRIAEIYGYLICLLCVIGFLITTGGLIQALIDKGHPFQSREATYQKESLVSFDYYVLEKRLAFRTDTTSNTILTDTIALRKMFEEERNNLIEKVNHRIRREIIVNSSILFLSVLLFLFHWQWLKKRFSLES